MVTQLVTFVVRLDNFDIGIWIYYWSNASVSNSARPHRIQIFIEENVRPRPQNFTFKLFSSFEDHFLFVSNTNNCNLKLTSHLTKLTNTIPLEFLGTFDFEHIIYLPLVEPYVQRFIIKRFVLVHEVVPCEFFQVIHWRLFF